jgi:prevent-host-death family protein
MEALLSVYEAKTHFSSYLQRATAGESFTVTSHGKPVARISPPLETTQEDPREAQIRAAVARIKQRSKDPAWPKVTMEEAKEWINEGRKW